MFTESYCLLFFSKNKDVIICFRHINHLDLDPKVTISSLQWTKPKLTKLWLLHRNLNWNMEFCTLATLEPKWLQYNSLKFQGRFVSHGWSSLGTLPGCMPWPRFKTSCQNTIQFIIYIHIHNHNQHLIFGWSDTFFYSISVLYRCEDCCNFVALCMTVPWQ